MESCAESSRSGELKVHRIQVSSYKARALKLDGRRGSVFFIGVVNHDAAEILGQVKQALVALVPFGGSLVDEHDALVRPAQLNEAGLADICAQQSGFFNIFVAGMAGVAQTVEQELKLLFLQDNIVHGKKACARGLGKFHKVLPGIGIVA